MLSCSYVYLSITVAKQNALMFLCLSIKVANEVLCDSGVLTNFVALKCVDNNEDNQTTLLVPGCNVAGGIVCRQSDRQVGFCAA